MQGAKQGRGSVSVARLWQAAGLLHPERGPRAFGRRARFVATALRHQDALAPLTDAAAAPLLKRAMHDRPQFLGFVTAPYLSARWDPATRIAAFGRHVATLERFPGLLDFDLDRQIAPISLPHLGPDYRLVLDKPIWLHREGVAALNLFRGDTRIFSLAFAIDAVPDGLVAYVGGVQGRDLDGMLDEYREMTRASHGMRPRDLLIELFRTFCRLIGVDRIYGIADEHRHARSSFFGRREDYKFHLNYDTMWEDRGGRREGDFYLLSTERANRDEADIPARKRATYRKRYALMDEMEAALRAAIQSADLPQEPAISL